MTGANKLSAPSHVIMDNKMNAFRNYILAFLVISLGACQATGDDAESRSATAERTVEDANADRAAIEEIDDAYEEAVQAGNPAAIVALHATDAVVLPDRGPALRGKAAIEAEFASRYATSAPVTLNAEEVVVSESGDLAYLIGSSSDPDGVGKYLTVLRKTGDDWKIVADAWNMDQPPAAADTL